MSCDQYKILWLHLPSFEELVLPSVRCLPSCLKKLGAKVAQKGKVSQNAFSIRNERESLEQIAFRNCTRRKQKFIFNIKVEHSELNDVK